MLGNESEFGGLAERGQGVGWPGSGSATPRRRRRRRNPPTTTVQDERFRSQGLDWRLRKRWGRGNALTFGTVLYHDDAPFRQWTSTDISHRWLADGMPRLDQQRDALVRRGVRRKRVPPARPLARGAVGAHRA